MVGSDQGGRSSRPLSASQKKKLRNRLRKLDQLCAKYMCLRFSMRALWMRTDPATTYLKYDTERMLTRNRIKGYE